MGTFKCRCAASYGGTRWRSWFRHCATSQKVAGSIPDGVIGIFHWHNPSSCSLVLGITQPLTEMSTGNISWGERWLVRRADNVTTFMCRLSWDLGASTSWNSQGLSRPVMGLLYLYLHLPVGTFKWHCPYPCSFVWTAQSLLMKCYFIYQYYWMPDVKFEVVRRRQIAA